MSVEVTLPSLGVAILEATVVKWLKEEGQPVARVAGRTARAQLTGVVRGMLPAGLAVTAGMKAGDIDPRCRAEHCFTVSDKARAIGGGVLEGLLYFERRAGLWSV